MHELHSLKDVLGSGRLAGLDQTGNDAVEDNGVDEIASIDQILVCSAHGSAVSLEAVVEYLVCAEQAVLFHATDGHFVDDDVGQGKLSGFGGNVKEDVEGDVVALDLGVAFHTQPDSGGSLDLGVGYATDPSTSKGDGGVPLGYDERDAGDGEIVDEGQVAQHGVLVLVFDDAEVLHESSYGSGGQIGDAGMWEFVIGIVDKIVRGSEVCEKGDEMLDMLAVEVFVWRIFAWRRTWSGGGEVDLRMCQ